MCEICINKEKLKEIVFKNLESGDEVSYCVSCYNHELENTKSFICESCGDFESRENLSKNEDNEFLCPHCYHQEKRNNEYDPFKEHYVIKL